MVATITLKDGRTFEDKCMDVIFMDGIIRFVQSDDWSDTFRIDEIVDFHVRKN